MKSLGSGSTQSLAKQSPVMPSSRLLLCMELCDILLRRGLQRHSGLRLSFKKDFSSIHPKHQTERLDLWHSALGIEVTGAFKVIQDRPHQKKHPLCGLYRDLPPLNPKATPPRLGGRAVVRRGQTFAVQASEDVAADSVVMAFLASKPGVETDAVIGKPGKVRDRRIEVEVPADAPVGEYELRLVHGEQHTTALGFIVIFNPFTCKSCPESAGRSHRQRQEFMDEYVGGEQGLLWQGLSDDHGAHAWQHDPFRAANLLIAMSLLADLPQNLRADPTAVSRHLTFVIGEKVCYGSLAIKSAECFGLSWIPAILS